MEGKIIYNKILIHHRELGEQGENNIQF